MIIRSNALVPRGFSAMTVWPFIFVRPGARNDLPLIEHELVHYREQAWITPLWLLRYALNVRWRVAAEVRAYRVQIALGGLTVEAAAHWLMRYDDGLTYNEARRLLS